MMKLQGMHSLVDQLSNRGENMDRFLLTAMADYNRRHQEVTFVKHVRFSGDEHGVITSRGDLILITSVIRFTHYLQSRCFYNLDKERGFSVLYYGPSGLEGFLDERACLLENYGHHLISLPREVIKVTPI
jgi:hypothetical protein